MHRNEKVLILRRSARDEFLPGIEELPSGGVEPGEDLFAALARELQEEIGSTTLPTIDEGFMASFDYQTGSGRKARQYTFSVEHDGTPIRLSGEHTSYRWQSPVSTSSSDLTCETRQTIELWTQYLGLGKDS